MLKASLVKLMDGTEYENVELIPSDDGLVMLVDSDAVIHLMHHTISLVRYEDPGTCSFVRGRALAMYYEDSEKVSDILQDFDYELSELATFISDSLSQEEVPEAEPKDGSGGNPYE